MLWDYLLKNLSYDYVKRYFKVEGNTVPAYVEDIIWDIFRDEWTDLKCKTHKAA